jgi:hypothetical protein
MRMQIRGPQRKCRKAVMRARWHAARATVRASVATRCVIVRRTFSRAEACEGQLPN